MISEIRYVTRSLLRRKGFTSVTVLTLALGIGAATAIYAMVDWFLFQGQSSPEDLYMIGNMSEDGRFVPSVFEYQFKAYSADETLFSEFAISAYQVGNVVVDRKPVGISTRAVSPNFFKMLGVSPAMGRGFVAGEDVQGRDQAVVVSYNFWKNSLGGSAEVLGSQILVNQDACTVIGVLREGLRLPPYCASDVFRPLVLRDNSDDPWDPSLIVIGHARPGVTKGQAQAALSRIKVDTPVKMKWYKPRVPALQTMHELEKIYRPEVRWMMLGAVGFLYAIACLNATNLMLVHLMGKQRETSIRLALGGGRWGLIRLLLIESFGLSICSSLLGALVANWLIPVFRLAARNQSQAPDPSAWHLYWRTYLVLGGLTLLTGTAIALVPGLNLLRVNIQGGLKSGGGAVGESRGMARLRSTFVVLQATFAVVLLVGAGLMVRTFQHLEDVELGFDPSHRINLRVNFPSTYSQDPKDRLTVLRRLQAALQRVPGVSTVAFGSESLLAGYESITNEVEARDGSVMKINGAYVSPDYQKAGGLSLKAGKWLSPDAQGDVMVNETLARTRFGATDPVGQYLKPTGATGAFRGWRVVGVVGDVREILRSPPGPRIYMPITWSPMAGTSFVVEMTAEPTGESVTRLRQAIYLFDPRIVSASGIPLANLRLDQLRNEHLALSVLKVLSAIAILLTAVGMFSMLAYTVDRRMGEFGIRMALGATPANLISLVMRRGIALTALGVAVGTAAALGLTRFLQSLLFETPPYDPAVMAGVATLILLSSLAACTLPAFKASKPDVSRLMKSD